jgi:hypothetical protein
METIKINVYSIEELKKMDDKAYHKALSSVNDFYLESLDDDNFLKETLINEIVKLTGLDFDEINIFYSLSSSQGDGVSFTTEDIFKGRANNIIFQKVNEQLTKTEKEEFLKILNDGETFKLKKVNIFYSHKYTCQLDFSGTDTDFTEKIKKLTYDYYLSTCDQVEKVGYDLIDVSDDYLINYSNINELNFYKNGSIFRK